MHLLRFIFHLCTVILLSILTQVGGLIWLLSLYIAKRTSWKKRYTFSLLYLVFNLIIISPLASAFGRERLPVFSNKVAAVNWFYPLAFRNYVTPKLKTVLLEASKTSPIKITYLDANFPFINGFLLLPHLSHNDGKKVDLSFMYLNKNGKCTDKKPSVSGYGVFVKEKNLTATQCINNGYWQYDYSKYLTFGSVNDLVFDAKRTKQLIKILSTNSKTQKIFIEPYLKQSLGLQNASKVRFHGCQAVRHDDHIHLQIK